MRTKLDTYIIQTIVWGLRAVEYVFWCIIREESNTARGRVGKIQLKSQSANMEGTWLKPFQKSSLLLQLQICIISKRPREQTCDRIFYSWGWLGFYESPLETQNQHSDAGVYVRQCDPRYWRTRNRYSLDSKGYCHVWKGGELESQREDFINSISPRGVT